MEQNKDRRTRKNRRESSNERSEKYLKYFIPEKDEKRIRNDRRQADLDKE